jgi:hypothetical protein
MIFTAPWYLPARVISSTVKRQGDSEIRAVGKLPFLKHIELKNSENVVSQFLPILVRTTTGAVNNKPLNNKPLTIVPGKDIPKPVIPERRFRHRSGIEGAPVYLCTW